MHPRKCISLKKRDKRFPTTANCVVKRIVNHRHALSFIFFEHARHISNDFRFGWWLHGHFQKVIQSDVEWCAYSRKKV